MIRGIYTAATGMLVQEMKQDSISNNLANINTPGYKKDDIAVSSFPQVLIQRIDAVKGSAAGAKPIGNLNNGATVDRQVVDWSGGILEETGNPLDLAINGEGFFTVETPEGLRFTKNGAMHLDDQGYLVSSHGHYVLGLAGPIQLHSSDFQVGEDGALTVEGFYVDNLLITRVEDLRELNKAGHDLYSATENANPGMLDPEQVKLKQGFIEKPDINLVAEMANMLAALRTYEANQKIIQTHDEMLAKSVNEIGSLR